MLYIKLIKDNIETIVGKTYLPTSNTLEYYIEKSQQYVKKGYSSAYVCLLHILYLGDLPIEKEMELFSCTNNSSTYSILNMNEVLTISSVLTDFTSIEEPIVSIKLSKLGFKVISTNESIIKRDIVLYKMDHIY